MSDYISSHTGEEIDAAIDNISNPNLLINGDFRVNQREFSSVSGNTTTVYTVDRWRINRCNNVSFDGNEITISNPYSYGWLSQTIEDYERLKGKTVTLTVEISSYSSTANNQKIAIRDGVATSELAITGVGTYTLTKTISASATMLDIRAFYNSTGSAVDTVIKIKSVKLELGSVATPFSPRPYAEELAMCQRYGCALFGLSSSPYGAENIGYVVSQTQISFNSIMPTTLRQYHSLQTTTGISGTLFTSLGRISFANATLTCTEARTGNNNLNLMLVLASAISVTVDTIIAVRIDTPNFVDAEIY